MLSDVLVKIDDFVWGPVMLILLVGTNQENCDIIFRRIAARFTQKHGSWNKYLEYYVSSIADVENPNARLSFQKNEFRWK